jgi:hypothetical protein
MLAGPPRKALLAALISAFGFQRFSFSVRSLNRSGGLLSVALVLRPPARQCKPAGLNNCRRRGLPSGTGPASLGAWIRSATASELKASHPY